MSIFGLFRNTYNYIYTSIFVKKSILQKICDLDQLLREEIINLQQKQIKYDKLLKIIENKERLAKFIINTIKMYQEKKKLQSNNDLEDRIKILEMKMEENHDALLKKIEYQDKLLTLFI